MSTQNDGACKSKKNSTITLSLSSARYFLLLDDFSQKLWIFSKQSLDALNAFKKFQARLKKNVVGR